ncbi:hypothetical protein VP1G_03749 [Cytospora mali]|uniref:Uncharacterized protein n=1 Tax=Cytospora mali TaxID=578113 RepID=A0A194UXD0_CYTMA|nr:hypothetical protein VP1G_03749 [Valsa mali var. pyri (nom. inval.)]
MSLEEASDHCNRVAPFYILRNEAIAFGIECPGLVGLLINDLLYYVFRKWSRPYRSEIEYGRFLAKVIVPLPSRLPEETQPKDMVALVKGLNASVCAGVENTQNAARALNIYARKTKLYGLAGRLAGWIEYERSRAQIIRDKNNFILQPLFRAVAIAIRVVHYDPKVIIGRMPVLIVRTGIEDGLGAPINFDSIAPHLRMVVLSRAKGVISAVETDLETAVGFLMDLEQREIAAFGLRPDPLETTRDLQSGCLESRESLLRTAKELGWNKEMGPLEGPSSNWVDMERYPTWSGRGFDSYSMYQQTFKLVRRNSKEVRGRGNPG